MKAALISKDESYSNTFRESVDYPISVFKSCGDLDGEYDVVFTEPNFDYRVCFNSKMVILINGDLAKLESFVVDKRVWAILKRRDFEQINNCIKEAINRDEREESFKSLTKDLEIVKEGLR